MKHNCPYCKTINSGFTYAHSNLNLIKSYGAPKLWNIFFECNNCGMGVVCEVQSMVIDEPSKLSGDIKSNKFYIVHSINPQEIQHEIPDYLPPQVLNAFKEGVINLPQSPNAAGAMFRRSLEIGLKLLDPKSSEFKLLNRIDRLASEGKITNAIKEWSHQIRLDGNDALHEIEELTNDDAEQLHLFTKYSLLYLFTLPKQVELAKSKRDLDTNR